MLRSTLKVEEGVENEENIVKVEYRREDEEEEEEGQEDEDEGEIEFLESEDSDTELLDDEFNAETDDGVNNEGHSQIKTWDTNETRELIKTFLKYLPLFYEDKLTKKQAWTCIMEELNSKIDRKFSEEESKGRIQNVKLCYQDIIEKKRIGLVTIWPLNNDAEHLITTEQQLRKKLNVPEDGDFLEGLEGAEFAEEEEEYEGEGEEYDLETCLDEDLENDVNTGEEERNGTLNNPRWTRKDTRQLISVYEKYLRSFRAAHSNMAKRKIWETISEKIDMGEQRRCNPYSARLKFINLKRTYQKHKRGHGRDTWPFFQDMERLMKAEKALFGQQKGIATVEPRPPSPIPAPILTTTTRPGKRKADDSGEPAWFTQYRSDAKRRHEEKMDLKLQLLQALEQFAQRIE